MRKFLLSLALASTFTIGLAATAVASTTYHDTVVGIETGQPTAGLSPFAGYAFGQLPGPWFAGVVHGNLPTTQGAYGEIYRGGYFTLTSGTRQIAGTFDPNPQGIQLIATSSDEDSGFCTQTYLISDTLKLVSPAGIGSFVAILRHYGFMVGGQCAVFGATVSGTVDLIF
jgi:hypothetical protein